MTHPSKRTTMVRVEVDIPEHQLPEFDQFMIELQAGRRPRLEALEREAHEIADRAATALAMIVEAIEAHPGTGQSGRLVRFLAGVYNGQDFPFDLTDLRGLDAVLASACLDYLNYDRLGKVEVHRHLPGGERQLHTWLAVYGLIGPDAG